MTEYLYTDSKKSLLRFKANRVSIINFAIVYSILLS